MSTRLRAIAGGAINADACFEGSGVRPRFVAPRLSRALRAESPTAVGGELLHRYRDGAYRPDGDEWARTRVAEVLGERWTRNHSDEVLAHLRAVSPRLTERPPLNVVNCANGLLDLNTGKLGSHTPDLLSPVQIAAAFDPKAKCATVKRFLAEVLDAETVEVFYELAGYLIVPDNSLQRAVMMLGSGNNGKSTAAETLTRLLGAGNVEAVPLHKLDEDRFAVASLSGKLANVFADLDGRDVRSSSIFKSITGGDRLTADRKFRSNFTFTPYTRLVFSANAAPPTSDSSDGFFRRWLILPFDRVIAPGQRDPYIVEKLTSAPELLGLLNEGVVRLGALRSRGDFAESEKVVEARRDFRIHADSVAGFIDEECLIDPDLMTVKSALASAYREWCLQNGRAPVATVRFNDRLGQIVPVETKVVKGTRFWQGLRMARELP